MKRVFLSIAVVAALGLTSCGGPDICDCINNIDDEGKPKDEGLAKKCDKMEEDMKDATEEEQKELMEKALKCMEDAAGDDKGGDEEGH